MINYTANYNGISNMEIFEEIREWTLVIQRNLKTNYRKLFYEIWNKNRTLQAS